MILAVGIAPQDAINDMQMAKRVQTMGLPPVVACLAPATSRPGWLRKMMAARDELEEVLNRQEVCA